MQNIAAVGLTNSDSATGTMALREFKDSAGIEWRVWDVHPTEPPVLERRVMQRRRIIQLDFDAPERRDGIERRVHARGSVQAGWLSFESRHEKRRLAPIPPGWEIAPDTRLQQLLTLATPVRPLLEWRNRTLRAEP